MGGPHGPYGCPHGPYGCSSVPYGCPQDLMGVPMAPVGAPPSPVGAPPSPMDVPRTLWVSPGPYGRLLCPLWVLLCPLMGVPMAPMGAPPSPMGAPLSPLDVPRTLRVSLWVSPCPLGTSQIPLRPFNVPYGVPRAFTSIPKSLMGCYCPLWVSPGCPRVPYGLLMSLLGVPKASPCPLRASQCPLRVSPSLMGDPKSLMAF